MTREHLQRGQALPAVMVIMVLLSLIAGGLAIVVSGALSQLAVSRGHLTADLATQNGIEVAAARIQQGACAAAGPASAPRITRTSLPGVTAAGGAPGIRDGYCLRVDHVYADQLKRWTVTASSQTAPCMSFAVPQSGTFGMWFQVGRKDIQPSFGLRADTAACSEGLSKGACTRPATIQANKSGDPPLTQAGFACSLPQSPMQPQLLSLSLGRTLRELDLSSITLWIAPGVSTGGGSLVLVASPTGGFPAYEQALLLPTGGSGLQLLREERLE